MFSQAKIFGDAITSCCVVEMKEGNATQELRILNLEHPQRPSLTNNKKESIGTSVTLPIVAVYGPETCSKDCDNHKLLV